jgi:hypothetical protein
MNWRRLVPWGLAVGAAYYAYDAIKAALSQLDNPSPSQAPTALFECLDRATSGRLARP